MARSEYQDWLDRNGGTSEEDYDTASKAVGNIKDLHDTTIGRFVKGYKKGKSTKSVIGMASRNTFEFPVFCSKSVPLDYATATNMLLEQLYAAYVQMAISQDPIVDAKSVKHGGFLSKFQTNTTRYVEYTDMSYAHDACHNKIINEQGIFEFDMLNCSDADAKEILECVDYEPLSEFDHFFQESGSARRNALRDRLENETDDFYDKKTERLSAGASRETGSDESTRTSGSISERLSQTKTDTTSKSSSDSDRKTDTGVQHNHSRSVRTGGGAGGAGGVGGAGGAGGTDVITRTHDKLGKRHDTSHESSTSSRTDNSKTNSGELSAQFSQDETISDSLRKSLNAQFTQDIQHMSDAEKEEYIRKALMSDAQLEKEEKSIQLLDDELARLDKAHDEQDARIQKIRDEITHARNRDDRERKADRRADEELDLKRNADAREDAKALREEEQLLLQRNKDNREAAKLVADLQKTTEEVIKLRRENDSNSPEAQKRLHDAEIARLDAAKKLMDLANTDTSTDYGKEVANRRIKLRADTGKAIADAKLAEKKYRDYDKQERDRKEEHALKMMNRAPEILKEEDMRKMNSMKPLLMKLQMRVTDPSGAVSDKPVEFIIGVHTHCRLIDPETLPDVVKFPLKEMNAISRHVKWKAGELRFLRDIVFQVKEKKQTAIDSRDPKRKWYRRLYQLAHEKGDANVAGAVSGNQTTGLIPNATIMITNGDVENIKSATKLDVLKPSLAKRLCNELFLISFVVIDQDAESIKIFIPDLHNDWEIHSLNSVEKQLAELSTAGSKTRDLFKLLN